MFMEPVLTERCILRRLTHSDADHVWSATRTPGFNDGMTWEPPKDYEEIYSYTDSCIEAWENGEKYVWTIEDKNTHEFIGRMEVCIAPELPGKVWGLGYWIHPLKQGSGYATEAAAAAIRFAFERLDADSIVTSHHEWNSASGKVLKKIGMKHTGFSEGRTSKNGQPVRAAEYWMDRKDWEEHRIA